MRKENKENDRTFYNVWSKHGYCIQSLKMMYKQIQLERGRKIKVVFQQYRTRIAVKKSKN